MIPMCRILVMCSVKTLRYRFLNKVTSTAAMKFRFLAASKRSVTAIRQTKKPSALSAEGFTLRLRWNGD
jgi:hypothetical protein